MSAAEIDLSRPTPERVLLRVGGAWKLASEVPDAAPVEAALSEAPAPKHLAFDAQQLGDWDTSLLIFLNKVADAARAHDVAVDRSGLPEGVDRLLKLASAVPEKADAKAKAGATPSLLARLGSATLTLVGEATDFLAFLGRLVLAFAALLTGKARFRASDLLLFVQQAGAEALPIITLISFLVGVIMAFVGAVQLQKFGAAIYIADLVGIAVVREMGAMMTGIVMAGRTGAAFAAQLGTMKVTQEIDALTTMGIDPMEFLVLPRALALCLMMPLLCLYSDLIGIIGGGFIATGMLDLSWPVYFNELFQAVSLTDLAGGIFKASVYGVLIALAGCLRGMQAGSSAAAVGDAATSAVVTGIVLIVSACGIFAFSFYILGI
ncbi:MAG: ABC transporter permease [Deltaproteobacteria bacterium]|nr:ABC transporter permease [Deltaproteobacteria bacterium]